MDPATGLASDEAGRDPDFHAPEVDPAKAAERRVEDPPRRRRQLRLRTLMLIIALMAVCMGVLLDPILAPLVVGVLGVFGIGLGVMAAAMGLGLLGFGLCAAGARTLGWLRRAGRWPDE
ncbi:MAG TPA: hypothetical protein VFF52_06210 [Isosphaeraceae bacterium]|nr:hypothetical protein [Isosphaeraceae bacterium]